MEDFLERRGFWYLIWEERIRKGPSNEEILEGSLRKMGRDASSKQGFSESRERAQKEYNFLKINALEILQRIRDVTLNQ